MDGFITKCPNGNLDGELPSGGEGAGDGDEDGVSMEAVPSVRLYPSGSSGRQQTRYLQQELRLLSNLEVYHDARLVCSDGATEASLMLACLALPDLAAAAAASHQPHLGSTVVLLPETSQAEVGTAIRSVITAASWEPETSPFRQISFRNGQTTDHDELLNVSGMDLESFPWLEGDLPVGGENSGRKRSCVWKYFRKSPDSKDSCVCLVCDSSVKSTQGSTSSMIKHLKRFHSKEFNELQAIQLKKRQEKEEVNDDKPLNLGEDKPGRKRSCVWQYFSKSTVERESCVCLVCDSSVHSSKGSTSSMMNHLRRYHRQEFSELEAAQEASQLKKIKEFNEAKSLYSGEEMSGRKRSSVWKYFSKSPAEKDRCVCLVCDTSVKSTKGSTSNMINHLKRYHRQEFSELEAAQLTKRKEKEDLTDAENLNAGKRRKKNAKSYVWKYFTLNDKECLTKNGKILPVVQCNMCSAKLRFHDSTKSLQKHLHRFHANLFPADNLDEATMNPGMPATCSSDFLWNYFSKPDLPGGKATCIACQTVLSTKRSSATSLIRHLRQQHAEVFQSLCYVCKLGLPGQAGTVMAHQIKSEEEEEEEVSGGVEGGEDGLVRFEMSVPCPDCSSRYHVTCVDVMEGSWCPVCLRNAQDAKLGDESPPSPETQLCPECGKEVKDLTCHINRSHRTSDKTIECEICKKVVKDRSNLNKHMRIVHQVHQNIVRFSCKFCERGFYNRPHLMRHVQLMHMTRSTERHVACPECDKVMLKTTIKKHIRLIHRGIRPDTRASCEECGKQFTQRYSLSIHMRRAHGQEPEVNRNKTNHSKSRIYVEPEVILEAYPELRNKNI